jgi:hypothetical protein
MLTQFMKGNVATKMSGAAVTYLAWVSIVAVLTLVSWALRPESRMLGVLVPTRSFT